MKKILKFLILIVIIVGIIFAGYYVYNNFIREDLGDLTEIVIPENDRDEIIDSLNTNEEKINMIIDLVNDINQNKIIYNTKTNNEITFQIYDDYRITYNISVIDSAKDYLNILYSTGTEKYIKISALKTSYIYHYYEYLNETYVTDQYLETNLEYEDEICYGRVNKNYVSEIEHSFLADYVKDLTDINSFTFIEEQNKFSLSNNDYSIETDGNTYLNIIPYKSFIKEIHLELNNKSLYQELISNLPKFEDFPEINSELKPKTNHKQLLRDYISSIEPKNETFDVETVDGLNLNNSLRYSNETLVNSIGFLGTLIGGQNFEIVENVSLNLTESTIQKTTTDGQTTYTVKATKTDIVKTSAGTVDDYSLDVTIVITSDGSCQVDYKSVVVYKSDDVKFKTETSTIETFNIVDGRIDKSTLSSKTSAKISDFEAVDSYNNKYVIDTMDYTEDNTSSVITMFVGNYIAKQ